MATENAKRDSNHVPVILGYDGTNVMMVRVNLRGQLITSTTITPEVLTPEHHNGSATTGAFATVTFSSKTTVVSIHNKSLTSDLLVSFDGGTTVFTIEAGAYFRETLCVTSLKLKGLTATVSYEVLGMVAP